HQPDHTLASRIVAGLSKNPPGREGWAAYAVVAETRWNGLGELLDSMSPDQLASARALARNRLTELASLLPGSRRPLPLPLDTARRYYAIGTPRSRKFSMTPCRNSIVSCSPCRIRRHPAN